MTTSDLPAISQLSPEAKRRLFALLARDLLGEKARSFSFQDAVGEVAVYAVPAGARAIAEKALRDASPEQLAELRERAATLNQSMSLEEAMQLPPPQSGSGR